LHGSSTGGSDDDRNRYEFNLVLQEGAAIRAGTRVTTSAPSTSTPITAAELLEQGFSAVEIRNLNRLRDNWNPAAEQVETLLDWRRIQFGKWLYEHGHYSEDIAA